MKVFRKINKWDFGVLMVILIELILLLLRWEMFPKFVDIYYHFSVAKAFDLANGIVLHDFWEYSPFGRPHLYPPLFHILMLTFMKIGIKVQFLMKFISFLMFPLMQVTSWIIFRKLFNKKIAFYTILLLSSSYSFYWFQTNMLPACLAIIFSILIFYLIENKKYISASLVLTLSFYTHLGISVITALSLLIYALLRKERLKLAIKTVLISLILYIPWLIHIFQHLNFLIPGNQANFIQWKLHFIMLVLALFGAFYCIKSKKELYIPISYSLAMLPFIYLYPSIYFNGHNLFSWSILGGVFLANFDSFSFMKHKKYLLIVSVLFILLITPVITIPKDQDERLSFKLEKGAITKLLFYSPEFADLNLLNDENLELAEYINKNTNEDDIFYIQNAYIGGLITSITGRSQVGAMYHEVKPIEINPQPKSNFLIIENSESKPPENYVFIKKIGGYELYEDPNVKTISNMPKFKIPLIYAYIFFLLIIISMIFDIRR